MTATVRPGRLRVFAVAALLGAGWLPLTAAFAQGAVDGPRVLVATVDHTITPVMADHVADGVARAEREGYEAFVIELDTPGGLVTSMQAIIRTLLGAEVPVVVHVAPRGAHAASAGALITYAAHVAAMAPGTAIGAATPVGMEGGDVEQKIVNDMAALAESIARERGRDVDFAVDSVREARSAGADEALEIGVIDLIAASLDALLDDIDGMEVTVADGTTVTLRTADAAVDGYDLGLLRRILQRLADPNIAFLFMSIGTLGVIYELASPGVGAGGIVGAVLIVLALFSLSVLPVNAAGLLFILLAAVLFGAELFAPGVGIFAFLGAVALVLGGIFLGSGVAGVAVSPVVVLPTALIVGGATVVAGRLAVRATRGRPSTTGSGVLVGRGLRVDSADGPTGQGRLEGSWWNLRSAAGDLHPGSTVKVVDVDGITLIVEPDPSAGPGAGVGQSAVSDQKGTTDG